MTETVYIPHQHKARPQGSEHDTLFASIELWLDQLPDVIVLGGHRYRRDETMEHERR